MFVHINDNSKTFKLKISYNYNFSACLMVTADVLHSDTRVLCVQELMEAGLLDQFHKSLVELNMDSAEELQSYINKLQLAVEQGRQKLLHNDGAEGKTEVGSTLRNLHLDSSVKFPIVSNHVCLLSSLYD